LVAPRHSDELLLQTLAIRNQYDTVTEAAEAAGVKRSTFDSRLRQATARGLDGSIPKPPPPGQSVKATSTLYDADGNQVLQWVKSQTDNLDVSIDAIREAFDDYKGRSELTPPPGVLDSDLLSVYPIADLHLGQLSWGSETGEDYDLKIASERLRSTSTRLISQSPPSKQAIILNLGDWTHQDDNKNMTPRSGHILDADGRYGKILKTGAQLMLSTVDLALQKHESVIVRNLPGNHDPHASMALTLALSMYYENNERVTIDADPSDFFFHRFGQILIGANHGHKMRADKMAMAMAVMRREDWGQTKYHYFYFGHIHHESAREIGDVRVESFQTIAAKDAHAASSGYVSGQSLVSITHHREQGEIGRHRVNIARAYV
jgi:hypothetical protein